MEILIIKRKKIKKKIQGINYNISKSKKRKKLLIMKMKANKVINYNNKVKVVLRIRVLRFRIYQGNKIKILRNLLIKMGKYKKINYKKNYQNKFKVFIFRNSV